MACVTVCTRNSKKRFPLSFILIETLIHPDVYYIHIYMHREHPHKGGNEFTVVQFPYRVTHGSRTVQKKYSYQVLHPQEHRNATKAASAHLRPIFVCVSLSLSVSFSLLFSCSLPSPLSLHISFLPSPLHTLSLLLHSIVGRWEVLLESSVFCSIWMASEGGWL